MGIDDRWFSSKVDDILPFCSDKLPHKSHRKLGQENSKGHKVFGKNILQMSLRYTNSEKKGRLVGGRHDQKEGRQEGEGTGDEEDCR